LDLSSGNLSAPAFCAEDNGESLEINYSILQTINNEPTEDDSSLEHRADLTHEIIFRGMTNSKHWISLLICPEHENLAEKIAAVLAVKPTIVFVKKSFSVL